MMKESNSKVDPITSSNVIQPNNITIPCILCRNENVPISGGKLCVNCYKLYIKEVLTNVVLETIKKNNKK